VALDQLVAELYAPAQGGAGSPPAASEGTCVGCASAARDELRRQARSAEREASTLARAVASATRLLGDLRTQGATRQARRRAWPAPGSTPRGPRPERRAWSPEPALVAAVLLMGWAVVLLRTGNGHAAFAFAVVGCALSWCSLMKQRARPCNKEP